MTNVVQRNSNRAKSSCQQLLSAHPKLVAQPNSTIYYDESIGEHSHYFVQNTVPLTQFRVLGQSCRAITILHLYTREL